MLLGRSATLLPRLVLCLSLLVATAGLAQGSEAPPPAGAAPADDAEPPPLVPAGESPEQPASHGEVFPREQDDPWGPARLAGRLILQPPAAILGGVLAGAVSLYPAFGIAFLFCGVVDPGSSISSKCFDYSFVSLTALGASVGAGLSVVGVGYLLGGNGRPGATLGGALAGSVVGGVIALLSGKDIVDATVFLLVGPALVATLVYALSDAFFPGPRRIVTPPKEEDIDEYARVLPMFTTTPTGGIIGGLAGRF